MKYGLPRHILPVGYMQLSKHFTNRLQCIQ